MTTTTSHRTLLKLLANINQHRIGTARYERAVNAAADRVQFLIRREPGDDDRYCGRLWDTERIQHIIDGFERRHFSCRPVARRSREGAMRAALVRCLERQSAEMFERV